MFKFLMDYGNYTSRCVGRWDHEDGKRFVSTAKVSDGRQPFETAFMHPDYNDGDMVIVEAYDTRAEAEAGHRKWVRVQTEGPLPKELRDCCNSHIAQLCDAVGSEMVYRRATAKKRGEKR